jgi:hypothetical protein
MKYKIALALALAGLLMAACGGDPSVSAVHVTPAGDQQFVPPAEVALDAPETDGGTCIDMKAASAARASADRHQGLLLEAWEAGDLPQTGTYMDLVGEDFWVIRMATKASPEAFHLADSASYGYAAGALAIIQAQVQFDRGDEAAGDALVDEANVAMAEGDAANAELTDFVLTGEFDGAPLCETVIDDGAFKTTPTEIALTGGK